MTPPPLTRRAQVALEWLQKHPTPRAADGDFHWWPGRADPDLLAELAAGADGDVTLWLTPTRVLLARRFTAEAPADDRRYTGLAAAIITAAPRPTSDTGHGRPADRAGVPRPTSDTASTAGANPTSDTASASTTSGTVSALLGAARVPAAAPWREGVGCEPVDVIGGALADGPATVSAGLVAAAWHGGGCAEPVDDALPARLAAIEAWLPAEARARPRRIVVGDAAPAAQVTAAARWLAGAIGRTGVARERARHAWAAAVALATSEGRTVDAIIDELAALDAAWGDAAGVRAALEAAGVPLADPRLVVAGDGDDQWARVLHGWGRGWIAEARTGALAAVVARRAVADALAVTAARAGRWRRAIRWEALLPADRAAALERAAITRVPALAATGDPHG